MFNLNEALDAIQTKPEFVHKIRDGFSVIDYNVTMRDTFVGSTEHESNILLNLRGTCFNDAGDIIRLPFHKFFNLNENESTQADKFDFKESHVIYEKIDGSMIAPIPIGDGYELGTRAGITDVSKLASDWLSVLKISDTDQWSHYDKFIRMCISRNCTPIFEYVSRQNKVVIDYPDANLILLDVRDNSTGWYIENVIADGVPTAKQILFTSSRDWNITELANRVRESKGEEGVVVKFKNFNARFVKIKSEDYCMKHRALDGLRHEKNVLKLVLEHKLDDVLSLVDAEMRTRLMAYSNRVLTRIYEYMNDIFDEFELIKATTFDKKAFALKAKESPNASFLFNLYNDKPTGLIEFLLKQTGSSTGVESVRHIIGATF